MDEFWESNLVGIEIWRVAGLFGCIVLGWIVGKVASIISSKASERLRKDQNLLTCVFAQALSRSTVFLGIVVGIQFGLLFIQMTERLRHIVGDINGILLVLAIALVFYRLVEVPSSIYNRWSQKQNSKLTEMLGPILSSSLKIAIVVLALVQIAQILSDKPVSSVIAGLGIGGLALALAAQDSIKHLFGSIVIFADRPFEVGDRLNVDAWDGTVERVGFRSTRIRTLEGHLLTIPNGELANKSISNVSKRPYIRRILNVTITYDTPPEKVEEALAIIKEILDNHEGFDEKFPPRVIFNEFNAASLNILVIYWYHPPIFIDYLAFTEKFNLQLLRRFNEAGINFAFPTQTIYLAGDPKRRVQQPGSPIQDLKELPSNLQDLV
jgi:MscS family membrane protein